MPLNRSLPMTMKYMFQSSHINVNNDTSQTSIKSSTAAAAAAVTCSTHWQMRPHEDHHVSLSHPPSTTSINSQSLYDDTMPQSSCHDSHVDSLSVQPAWQNSSAAQPQTIIKTSFNKWTSCNIQCVLQLQVHYKEMTWHARLLNAGRILSFFRTLCQAWKL